MVFARVLKDLAMKGSWWGLACGQISSQLVDRFHLSLSIIDLQPSTTAEVAQQNKSPDWDQTLSGYF